MRRLLAAAGVTALSLAIVAPMAQAVVPDGRNQTMQFWTLVNYDQNGNSHEQPDTASDGAQVWSTDEVVTVKVKFDSSSAPGGVKSWDVRIVPVSGGAPSTCHEDLLIDNHRYSDTAYLSCPWDTTRAVDRTLTSHSNDVQDQGYKRNWQATDRGPSVNGKYAIQVTARSAGQLCGILTGCTQDPSKEQQYELYQDVNAQRWREVTVVNGVAKPTGVNAAYDAGSSRINVTWAPNPEPDVSYTVEQKSGDGKWAPGGDVPGTATRYERVIEQPGTYQYRVRANRPSAPPSDFVAAQAVEVAQVAPPTTAGSNGADAVQDGGDPGVFLPGDTPGTTRPGGRSSSPARPGPSAARGVSGPASSGFRPSGSASTGTTAHDSGEAEGEGPDGGFSAVLPYDQPQEGFAQSDDGLNEEAGPPLAGGVLPKPRDTRQLLVYMAISLTLFVFAMQLTVLVRRSRPALAAAGAETYHDDFDDWLGGF